MRKRERGEPRREHTQHQQERKRRGAETGNARVRASPEETEREKRGG